ncbi:MAG: helix-turn-helix transcriptional regulator [Bacteroidota bacterium]
MISHKELIQTPEYWIETIQNELFREVHNYLHEHGMNQTQFADQLGVSKGYISQILNGNFNFTLSKLVELSLAIGVVPKLAFEKIEETTAQFHDKEVKPFIKKRNRSLV